jgi:phosphatidate cytidylyltransferase
LLKRIATAVILIPVVLAIILRAPVPALAIVAGTVAVLTLHEFLKLTEPYGVQPLRLATFLFTGIFFLLLAISSSQTPLLATGKFLIAVASAAGIAPFIFLSVAMRRTDLRTGYPAAAAASFGFAYIALPLAMLVQLRQQWAGAFYLLYLMLAVWAGDIFAYFVGKSIGRHRMAPRISPKKTWEGAAASIAASVGIGWALFAHAEQVSSALLSIGLITRRDGLFGPEQPPLVNVILLTIAINVAAQLGDLVESLIKRGAGVKDSGALLPGHGGMLDRIDAMLFAAPVLWFYVAWRVMQ